jgi:hypothetical protein
MTGLTTAKAFNLRPGIALTAEQKDRRLVKFWCI